MPVANRPFNLLARFYDQLMPVAAQAKLDVSQQFKTPCYTDGLNSVSV